MVVIVMIDNRSYDVCCFNGLCLETKTGFEKKEIEGPHLLFIYDDKTMVLFRERHDQGFENHDDTNDKNNRNAAIVENVARNFPVHLPDTRYFIILIRST